MGCPFCPLGRKTRWFVEEQRSGLVICEDLNPNGYKMRLLCVFSGTHEGRQWGQRRMAEVKQKAIRVADSLRQELEWSERVWDYEMSEPGHYHIQLCLR